MKNVASWIIVVAVLALLAPAGAAPVAQAQAEYVCFPTCSETDARFMTLQGTELRTIAGDSIGLEFMAPEGATSLEIAIFDGETGGRWDGGSVPLEYTLYADPHGDGSAVAAAGAYVVGAWLGSAMPDNAWYSISVPIVPEAQAQSGHYFYHMRVRNTNPAVPGTISNFKVRTDGMATLKAPLAFAFYGAISRADLDIVYPDYPDLTNTTYDGTWEIYLDVPSATPFFAVWDGDFDYGSRDCADNDIDDPDTDNAGVPPWAVSTTAVPEGVAVGGLACPNNPGQMVTGYPADDASSDPFALRSPSVIYEVTDSAGHSFLNGNPSGTEEWEQFRIESDPAVAADHHTTGLLPSGLYHIHMSGMDLHNLNAWRFNYDVLGLCIDNTACKDVLRPYEVGDRVWRDDNGDGVQDDGEPGIAGVVVTLKDSLGEVLGTATTGADGLYSFEVEGQRIDPDTGAEILDGVYSVEVAPENSALNGLAATTAEAQTNTVIDANVMTYDFGYWADGSIGDLVWQDSDADGVYEPVAGELPIAGVTVELYDAGGNLVATTATDAGGLYLFEDLKGGQYFVVVAAGNLAGGPLDGLTQTFDYDALLDNQTAYTLGCIEQFLAADFGYRPATSPGTGTPGYWKNHPEAWPVESITIGGVTYTKAEAIGIMQAKKNSDKTYDLFRALVSAKLNVGIGNESICIGDTILAADAWMAAHPVGSGVKANSAAWQQIAPAYEMLDNYNNGLLCAPHRG